MSRRRKPAAVEPPRQGGQDAGRHATRRVLRDIAVLLLAFGAGLGIAELFGAANLGVAFGVGQIIFAIVLVALIARG